MRKSFLILACALFYFSNLLAQSDQIPNVEQTPITVNPEDPTFIKNKDNSDQERLLGDCNIGNENDDGFTLLTGNFQADYISGLKYTLAEEGTLNSIGIVTQTTGVANVRMAVYDDLNGVPNNLISQSETAPVIIGTVTLPVTPILLPAGDYWITVSFDADGQHSKRKLLAGNISFYQALNFGDPAPSNASSFIMTTPNTDNLYFMDITCGAVTGVNDLNENDFSIYPNPTSEHLTIETNDFIFMDNIEIIDATGRIVKSFPINQSSKSETFDVSAISPGMYSVKFTSNNEVIVKSVIIE